MNNKKLNFKPLPDAVISEIIAGSVEGVEPTTHEIAMALELRERRSFTRVNIVATPPVQNLFINGVIDDGEDCVAVDDEDAQFWSIYRRNADGTCDALMDFIGRDSAETALRMIQPVTPTVIRWEELVTPQVPKQPADREKIAGCSWLDWNQLSAMGLLERINREILHPIGLAAYRNAEDGTSGGALISPDGKWEYADDARLPSKSSEGGAS